MTQKLSAGADCYTTYQNPATTTGRACMEGQMWFRIYRAIYNFLTRRGFDICWAKWVLLMDGIGYDDTIKTDPDCDWCGCCHKWHEPMGDYIHFPGRIEAK
jgi:hypothetical protein